MVLVLHSSNQYLVVVVVWPMISLSSDCRSILETKVLLLVDVVQQDVVDDVLVGVKG